MSDDAVVPYKGSLQGDRHCNRCGALCVKGERVVLALVPLKIGEMLTSHLIVWCTSCWMLFAGSSGQNLRETP